MRPAAVHNRALIADGEVIAGPAIIEQEDTTTLVPSGWRARCIQHAALLIEKGTSS